VKSLLEIAITSFEKADTIPVPLDREGEVVTVVAPARLTLRQVRHKLTYYSDRLAHLTLANETPDSILKLHGAALVQSVLIATAEVLGVGEDEPVINGIRRRLLKEPA
jgi:hypothetical protein